MDELVECTTRALLKHAEDVKAQLAELEASYHE